MSYKSMLRHRGDLLRLEETFVNGTPVHVWTVVQSGVRCFMDLNFVRLGKDPTWSPEAGRPTTRSGVGFFLWNAPLTPGMRIRMVKGPSGTFAIGGAVDEAWKPERGHHLEVSVSEVPRQIERGGGGMRVEAEGLDEAIDFFNGLQKPPVKTIFQLEKELAAAFVDTQAATHVITASLKLSGKPSSNFDGDVWEGIISYGGPSTGVNNPVDYAIYELARGGDHNFLLPARAHEDRIEKIINGRFS